MDYHICSVHGWSSANHYNKHTLIGPNKWKREGKREVQEEGGGCYQEAEKHRKKRLYEKQMTRPLDKRLENKDIV